jgi:ceramidase
VLAALGPECEAYRNAVIGQPANTLSSAAFLVVGGWCWVRARASGTRRLELALFGAATILVGLGSIAFHGPHPSWAQWAHDTSIAWLLLLVIVLDAVARTGRRSRETVVWIVGCAVVGFLLWVSPASQRAVFTVLGAALVLLEAAAFRGHRRPWPGEPGVALYLFAAAAFLVGTVSFFAGRLDRFCRPQSLWQWHAVWHVLLALALAAFAEVTLVVPGPPTGPYAAAHD